jgi:hypothetical protein
MKTYWKLTITPVLSNFFPLRDSRNKFELDVLKFNFSEVRLHKYATNFVVWNFIRMTIQEKIRQRDCGVHHLTAYAVEYAMFLALIL